MLLLLDAANPSDFPWASVGTGSALALFVFVSLKVLEFLRHLRAADQAQQAAFLAFLKEQREAADARDAAQQLRAEDRAKLFAETVRGMAADFTKTSLELSRACHQVQLEVRTAIVENTRAVAELATQEAETRAVIEDTKAVLGTLERRREQR